MAQYTMTFSEEERQALLQLIDGSVRAGGLQVAETAVIITKKILMTPPTEEVKDPSTDEGKQGKKPS